jgi:hypothetical protein
VVLELEAHAEVLLQIVEELQSIDVLSVFEDLRSEPPGEPRYTVVRRDVEDDVVLFLLYL